MEVMKGHGLPGGARKLIAPLIISLVMMLPFMIMELINRRSLPQDFPVVLFGFMWLLTLAFILILMPIVRTLRGGEGKLTNRLTFLGKVLLLTVIARLWVGLVVDQMPCFLGVPNCD